MEQLLSIDPNDEDDVRLVNGLMKQGYVTNFQMLTRKDEDSPLKILFHLRKCMCVECRVERGEVVAPDYDDDDLDDDFDPDHN